MPSESLKVKPVNKRVNDMIGSVYVRRLRRPRESIVHMAGNAPRKFMNPKMQLAINAPNLENPDEEKIVLL